MRKLAVALLLLAACGPAAPPPPAPPATAPSWKPNGHEGDAVRRVSLRPGGTVREAAADIGQGECPDAVFVWGDVNADRAITRPVILSVGTAELVKGFILCERDMTAFLRAQTQNPRLKAGHGGTADLRYAEGQLVMHRRWSAGLIPMGDMSTIPDGVFQKGEVLAALIEVEHLSDPAATLLRALPNVPKAFLFGMWPLH